MSINWVMLSPTDGFVRLPGEKNVYRSPPRTSLAITTPRTYPGNKPVAIHSSAGTLCLTNQRIVYLPANPTPELQSFSAPLLNLHDSHVTVPFFGPNAWQAVLQSVPGGNIPSSSAVIEVKIVFKEGGAPDFHSNFERIKERLQQAVEAARESGAIMGQPNRSGGPLEGVNMDAVHLDQLPSYEASGHDKMAPPPEQLSNGGPPQMDERSAVSSYNETPLVAPTPVRPRNSLHVAPPPDAPPGYEETQQQSVQQELENRLLRRF